MLCAALQVVYIAQPSYRTVHDDGIYLITAKALAEGKGYVIDSLPEPLAQTKYPILIPALMAAVWKVAPEFPANLPWLRLALLASYWGWLYLVWILIGDQLGMRERAKWITAMMMSAPLMGLSIRMPMSDLPFALLGTWIVLLLTRIWLDPLPPSMARILQLGLAFALAYHTRTVALALVPVAMFTLWRKRSWSGMAVFAAFALAAWIPWVYWQWVHPPPSDEMLRYYTQASYADWNLLSSTRVAQPWAVSLWNALAATTWIRDIWSVPSPGWLMPGYMVLAAVTARGLWTLSRGPGWISVLWTALVVVVILLWPWPPLRFLIPVFPFLLLGLTCSVPPITPETVRNFARAAATGLIVMGVWSWSQPEKEDAFWKEYAVLFDWLRANTSKDATLAGNMETSFWLYANRKSVRSYEYDPIRLFYQVKEDRSADDDARQLEGILRNHRVEFLVDEEVPNMAQTVVSKRQIDALQAKREGLLEAVFSTPSGKIRVFRVRLNNRREPGRSQSGFPSHEGAIHASPLTGLGHRPSIYRSNGEGAGSSAAAARR